MSDLSNAIAVSGTIFAACAAGASWMSVIRGQREAREQRQPWLLASAVPVFANKAADRIVLLNVINEGYGLARQSAFVLAAGTTEYVANSLGPGFVRYREQIRVRAKMEIEETFRGLVMCRDRKGRTWVWDLEGEVKSYDGKRFDPIRDFGLYWSDFYGEDLASWRRGESTVTMSAD